MNSYVLVLLVYSLTLIVSEAECSIAKKRRSLLIAEGELEEF